MPRITYVRKVQQVWAVDVFDEQGFRLATRVFMFHEGAFKFSAYVVDCYERVIKGNKLLGQINWRTLEVKDYRFAKSMWFKKCAHITKRQYGYLKGLAERNPL